MKRKVVGCLVGAVVGLLFGGTIGIAGFGGAIAGTVPFTILGGYVGWKVGYWLDRRGERRERQQGTG